MALDRLDTIGADATVWVAALENDVKFTGSLGVDQWGDLCSIE